MSLPALPDSNAVYLTPKQVCALLQLSEKSIYRLCKKDATMPALRIGGVLRFHRERLERWLRDREQGVARQRPSQKPLRSGSASLARPGQIVDFVLPAPAGIDVHDVEPGTMGQTVGQNTVEGCA